jgi:prephenate dehydrogenase
MALRQAKVARRVLASDADPRVAHRAVQRGAADAAVEDPRALRAAQVVIVSTPLDQIAQTCLALRPHLAPDAIVTDTGSAKAAVVRAVERSAYALRFVGGHPMAGTEGQGIEDADPSFLRGRPYLLTPTGFTDREAVAVVADLVRQIGMVPVVMQPEVHDRLVALVSHLPYLLACAAVLAASSEPESLQVGGPTFHELTRLARNPTSLWEQIVRFNGEEILRALELFRRELEGLERSVRAGQVRALLERAREVAQRAGGKRP